METVTRHLAVMGTALALTVSAPARDAAVDASEAAVRAVEAADRLLSTWRTDTPLARVNASAPGVSVPVAPELWRLLKNLFEWSEKCGGAFDPTVAPLVRAWGLRAGGRVPGDAELRSARAATGVRLFTFEGSPPLRISRLDARAGIDEGAWGKGWALDRAAEAARAAGASSVVLDLGGQVLASDVETPVAVAHPRDRARVAAMLRLTNASASTSGNSERGLFVSGRRVGHLLDPRTGEPAPDFGSVTVVAPDGLTADVLSTAFFVLGPQEGMALSTRLRAGGVAHETLFFLEGGDGRDLQVSMSPGMKRLVDRPTPRAFPSLPHSQKSSEGVVK